MKDGLALMFLLLVGIPFSLFYAAVVVAYPAFLLVIPVVVLLFLGMNNNK